MVRKGQESTAALICCRSRIIEETVKVELDVGVHNAAAGCKVVGSAVVSLCEWSQLCMRHDVIETTERWYKGVKKKKCIPV